MTEKKQVNSFVKALIQLQKDTSSITITKNKKAQVGKRPYYYADLSEILGQLKPILNKNGFVITDKISRTNTIQEGNKIYNNLQVETMIIHESGETLSSKLESTVDTTNPQEIGRHTTYLRRYNLTSLLGVCPEDDTDGASVAPAVGNPQSSPSTKQHTPASSSCPEIVEARGLAKKLLDAGVTNSQMLKIRGQVLQDGESLTSESAIKLIELLKNQFTEELSCIK